MVNGWALGLREGVAERGVVVGKESEGDTDGISEGFTVGGKVFKQFTTGQVKLPSLLP